MKTETETLLVTALEVELARDGRNRWKAARRGTLPPGEGTLLVGRWRHPARTRPACVAADRLVPSAVW
jgi:hypothetical protein